MTSKRDNLLIRSLFGRADVLTLLGRYEKSILDFNKIYRISKSDKEKVKSLIGLGKIYITIGDTKNSYTIFNKGLRRTREKKLSVEKAFILNGLANAKILETKTKEAKKYAKKALEEYKSLHRRKKERIKGIADSLNTLGGIYSSEGNFEIALKYYAESLNVRKTIEDKEGIAINFNNIGVTYMEMREYKKALVFLEKSLILRKEMGFVQGIALCSGNIGIIYWKQRRYSKALEYFEENVKTQRILGDNKGLATSLNNIGVVYKTHGKYDDAIRCHEESLKIRNEMGDRFGMTINLNQLGWIYLRTGNYRKALSTNRREEKICFEIKKLPRLMNYYNLRGNISVSLGKFKEGYRYVNKSLEINRTVHSKIDEARSLYDLGYIIILANEKNIEILGTLKMANRFFEKGMKIAEKFDQPFNRILFLMGFSMIDLKKKRFEKAMKKIEEAEKIAIANNYIERMPEILYIKGRIFSKMKIVKRAKKTIKIARDLALKLHMKPLLQKIEKIKIKE